LLWRRCCRVSPACPESAAADAASASVATSAADIWAFGLLLWSAFTIGGGGSGGRQRRRDLLAEEGLSLGCGLLPRELAGSLEHLVRSCLYEVPQLRISASELCKQLRSLMDLRSRLYGDKYGPATTYSSLGAPFSSSGLPSPSPSSNQLPPAPQRTARSRNARRGVGSRRRSLGGRGGQAEGQKAAS
uniref:Protein kinase domain-containing protein n=1 Tax=Macrostomum lignano TaxID=282301 RepID=A0A1I8IJ46_9PLAT